MSNFVKWLKVVIKVEVKSYAKSFTDKNVVKKTMSRKLKLPDKLKNK